ncbi:hypothetical protein EI53_02160 [Fusobacterium naviforme]|nr:hypothetical protein F7P78_10450 [Fusobacterium naviforme]PSL08777.1 hypothetical protein EI53_02160 [Fusobacterium naviforme]STO28286.1 Uncharacterised protein [Fusobacterium naviforme]
MKKKKILLWYDVEDYVTVESEEALLKLLGLMHEYGVRATLKICTKKYEQLIQNGRTDILKLFADHELAFHMTTHSVHPIPSEYLDRMGFEEGAREFDRRENEGFEKLKEFSGQNLTSYGHPGVAWAPQVFPVLRKWGIRTYLDVHDILEIEGQPFWFGGVLCYTKLNNLAHLDKDASECSLIKSVENMDESGCQNVVFLSMYDHPHELICTEFWDSVNFSRGKNPPYLTPAPLRKEGEFERLLDHYRVFFEYVAKHEDIEFVTAQQAMHYEEPRLCSIRANDIYDLAVELGNEVIFKKIKSGWLSASEILNLMSRYLTGRFLIPEMIYGPEHYESSVVHSKIAVKELAEAVFTETHNVFGYKQLPPLYRIGDNFINPVDAFATLAMAICKKRAEVEVQIGKFTAENYVNKNIKFGGDWDLWRDDFRAENIINQTILQTWTLKPSVF